MLHPDYEFNIDDFRTSPAGSPQPGQTIRTSHSTQEHGLPRHRPGEKFLKGPIPMAWLSEAARLPGKTLVVAIAIWHVAFLKNSPTVKVTSKALETLGVAQTAKLNGLNALERAGLVAIARRSGASHVVTLLPASTTKHPSSRADLLDAVDSD